MGGFGHKNKGQKAPKEGIGKVCPLCGSYNKKDATVCGNGKPNAGCGAALPPTLTRFPSYAPSKGKPTVAPVENAPSHVIKNNPIHPYGKLDVKASAFDGVVQPDAMTVLKQKIKKKDDINMTWASLAPD